MLRIPPSSVYVGLCWGTEGVGYSNNVFSELRMKIDCRRLRLLPALILACCWSAVAIGQIPDTWQPIPKEDLALKDNPAAPGSAAMILERQTYTDDEKRLETEWIRIKVLTEGGKDYADVQIPYLARGTSIEGIRGRTVRADGTEIPFSGTVFDTVLVKYKRFRYDAKTFTLPGVEAGSIIEYAYTIRWKDKLPDYVRNPAHYLFQEGWTVPSTTWTIQRELFTRHAVFILRPVKNGRIGWSKVRLSEGPSSQSDGTVRLEIAGVPALEKEDYMPPESMLTSRVHLYYEVGYLGSYWHDFGQTRAQMADKYLEKTKFLEREADRIAPSSEAPESRLRKLYARVQQIRNISYEDNKTDKELRRENLADNKNAEDIYRHGYGYGNEINCLFTALARAAGFDASIVEEASRDSGLFDDTVLDATQLNSMVVQVRLNGRTFYLDPATRYCPFGLLPWYETNTGGVRWDKLGGEVVRVPDDDESSSLERTAELLLQPDGMLEGNLEATFTRHEAMNLRWSAMDADEAGRKKLIEKKIKEWLPAGTAIEVKSMGPWEDAEQPLRVQVHLSVPHFGVLSPKRMLLQMSVFEAGNKALLPQVYRREPVYLRFGSSGFDKLTISLPQGYRIEAVPSDKDYESTVGVFHFKRAMDTGKLRLERRTVRTAYYFRLDSYNGLRQFYEELRQQDAENVVLHRIENEASK